MPKASLGKWQQTSKTVSKLSDIPNMGESIAGDLQLIGIVRPKDLLKHEPLWLYDEVCRVTGKIHDPCLLDVFIAAVDFMNGGAAKPWWSFTKARKKILEGRKSEMK